jgi:hypothetical protein
MPPALYDTQRPDVEIEDLWPAFLATHPSLQVPNPLTRQAYNALAPTLGPWLMATQGLAAAMAQVGLESIWSVLAGLHGPAVSSRFHALYAVLRTPCPRWAAPFDLAVGYDGVLFAYPEVLSALAIAGERPEVLAETEEVREAMARVEIWHVTTADGVRRGAVSLNNVVDWLSPLSMLPACQWLWHWIRTEYAPAIARYGHYDPARGHAAPVGQELDALERREGARELLNDLLPGLGDATLAAGAEEPGTDD